MREITKKHNDRHFGFGKAQSDRGNEDVRHRHLRRAFWRGGVAVLLAAALVVSDALPVGPPVGLPDTVKAADPTPKTGTITFYEYQLRRYDNAWAREYFSTSYQDAYSSTSGLFIYEYDGTCYAVMNELTSDGKWPTCKVDVFGWEYTPGADVFYARTMPRTYDLYKHDKYFAINLVADDVGYKYYGIDGNSNGIYHYEIARNDGSTNNWYRPKWWMILQTTNKIRVYNSQTSLCGRDSYIGSGSEDTGTVDFWLYASRGKKTYTCINADFKLGDNQVYVADEDLFLSENVKLTIPEGAVLCVKNGPFYVNGEIECSGTILVEDGGSILPYASEAAGSRIVLKEGGAMIIRSGGRVYAGCPKGSLGTAGDQGWLDMYAGSSIINFGLLVAGQCNFKYGQATLENHKGGAMFIGYTVDNKSKFMSGAVNGSSTPSSLGLVKTNGTVHYGKDSNLTVVKAWYGGATAFANKNSGAGQTIKLYSYDKDGKCTVKTDYEP